MAEPTIDDKIDDRLIEAFDREMVRVAVATATLSAATANQATFGSPIEILFARAVQTLLMCNWYYSCSFAFLAKRDLVPEDLVARYTEGDRDKKIDAVLAPQVRIGPYRVDFLLAYRVNTQDSMWENKFVVVECDGHAFHERTKLQAAKDKARDRWLQHQGYKVLRFTGSEIWTNPYRCANEVLERAHTEMWESEGAVLLARAERDGEV